MSQSCIIGAHCSAAGGPANALYEGRSIGASCIQLFTANQRQWHPKGLDAQALEAWHLALAETGISHVMSHDSYLINLGAPDPEVLSKSRAAFAKEIERCQALGVTYLNFHPGAALKQPRELCAERIVDSLLACEHLLAQGSLTLLIETTAGQGSVYGCSFEELGFLVEATKAHIPIGICVDTCHIFAAGYDIRTTESWDAVLQDFDAKVGLQYLRAMHLNDSKGACGSRLDRHRPLGEGEIGIESFRFVMQDPRLKEIPKYLETPDGPELWVREIELLKGFYAGEK